MAQDPACRDFHRTEVQARTLLDRPISRRSLLQIGVGATVSFYAARALPLTDQLAAAQAAASANPDAPVLVHVFVPGGLDLLDTLVPLEQAERYAALRPALHVQDAQPLQADGRFGVHPSLAQGIDGGLKGLADRGRLGFIPGIDYANPDLSHFNSRHFWETGIINLRADSGWLARWHQRHGDPANPFGAVSMSGQLSPVLRGTRAPVAAIESPADAQVWIPGVWGRHADRTLQHYAALAKATPRAEGPATVNQAIRQSRAIADRLRPLAQEDGKPDPLAGAVAYPEGDFPKRLQRLAGLIAQPLGIRVATVEAEGDFDTHDDQKAVLTRDLGKLSEALSAFQADLEQRGLGRRVLTFVWTEFGRRPKENASGGTDHGAGGLAMVMGGRARSGVLSEYPSLSALDRDHNLAVTADFRAVYAGLLEGWLGTGADEVLPDARQVGRVQVVA